MDSNQSPYSQFPQYPQQSYYGQYPQYYQYPAVPPPHYAPQPRNGLGTAGMVLGIVACVLGIIPYTIPVGFVAGVVGLPLACVGRARYNRGEATNKSMTTAGIVLNTIAVVAIAVFVIIGIAVTAPAPPPTTGGVSV